MGSVGRGPLALLLVVVLAGTLYGIAVSQPATAEVSPGDPAVSVADPVESPAALTAPRSVHIGGSTASTGESSIPPHRQAGPAAESNSEDTVETTDRSASERSAPLGTDAATTRQTDDDAEEGIVLTQEFRRLPEEPGAVEVTYNYSIPNSVVTLRSAVPGRGNVTATEGFAALNETIYDWEEGTVDPSITYRLDVNRTGTGDHVAANGSLVSVDVGEWALFRRPPTSTSWQARAREPIAYERRTVTDGPGASGEWLVYLGEGLEYTRGTDNETLRLIVPDAANLSERPDELLDSLERAGAELQVGERPETLFAVAAPTDSIPWAVRGLSVEGSDLYVGDRERLDTPENIWVHEYVHARQDYDTTAETRWTREGFATYYAAYHALQHRNVSFEEFANGLAQSGDPADNVTLADPGTWTNRSDYDRGGLVAGHIDRRIRAATDGERTLDTVLAGMNNDTDRVNETEFFTLIESAIGQEVDRSFEFAIVTDRPVRMWNRTQHVRDFGGMPPQIVAGLPQDLTESYAVEGPYRNTSIDGLPPTLVSGETLVVDAEVRNVGGSSGYYDVDLAVDGELVDTADGAIPAGAVREVPLRYTFERAGEYTITVGDDEATVRVLRPATATLVDFNVSRSTLQQYQSTSVGVTVHNGLSIPAERTVTLKRDSQNVLTRSIRVGPNTTTTAEFDVEFPANGTSTITVDDREPVTVSVQTRDRPTSNRMGSPNATTTAPPTGPSSALGPGFGAIAALVVLLGALLVVRRQG